MFLKKFLVSVVMAAFPLAAYSEVVDFCARFLRKTDRPNEMRCIAERSAFASSAAIINNEADGPQSEAYFVGKIAHNRRMDGRLESQITPAGRMLYFKGGDNTYNFEIFVLMQEQKVLKSYWKVTYRRTNLLIETVDLNCYGSLWQAPH